ncbi:unnamed protein product [Adineta steineri]|uniref:Ig-like domain-containing protein n=1 Tax=Adineta steineri TaxID=433720 RepID=A0A819IG94_9BILA|nr:unnamed protein product [Adineta steineri]CAF3589789.1 unnamed protein product [Adineta steineri]CAF3916322.1 unnamed protein product [Adineta steineri]
MTNCLNEDSSISREFINVNVGKRIRIECELNNSTINGNKKGLWLRLEDAEVFFYSTSRINSDQRFQIEQRSSLHMINSTLSYEIITYSLIIDDIHLTDGGTYSCQADNKIIKLFILNIVERPYFITHEYSTLLRTQIGRNISITCEAQGKPDPYLNWMKKIDEYNQKVIVNCSTTPTTCQLNLINVDRYHTGIYECVAMNIVGTIGRFYELDVQYPPDVHSLTEEYYHFIGDAVILECLIDSNPEPDIRWLHRYSNDIKQEIDLSRQFYQEHSDNNNNQDNRIWYIKHEQLNATRWKTNLFIKRIPRRLFNSNFICRAINHHGVGEQSINIIEKHHPSKKHRHTTPEPFISNNTTLSSTIKFISQTTNNIYNRSKKLSSNRYYLFILGLYSFLSSLYV